MLQQRQVPVILDDKQQYLISNGILTIKQKLEVKAGELYMKQEKLKFIFRTE
jgi:hypothetical protein